MRQPVPLEVYGRLPTIESAKISPDGSRIAYVRNAEKQHLLIVRSLSNKDTVDRVDIGSNKLRTLSWADNEHLLLVVSTTALPRFLIGQAHEWYQLLTYDIKTQRTRVVPNAVRLEEPRAMNVIQGEVMVRHIDGNTVVFVRGAFVDDRVEPMLIRANLTQGGEEVVRLGNAPYQNWIVDQAGDIVLEENYDPKTMRWAIKTRVEERLKPLADGTSAFGSPVLLGLSETPDSLLISLTEEDRWVWKRISLARGTIEPVEVTGHGHISPIHDDVSQQWIGTRYVDDSVQDAFIDAQMQKKWTAVVKAFGGDHVQFVSASADFAKIVVRVDGPINGLLYQIIDFSTHSTIPVGDVYDGLVEPLPVKRITYTASDGLQIPAYLTLPNGQDRKGLPLIVFPHGGPEGRDSADFDWWAQALAEQGYAVLQPNFRGSTVSPTFVRAGYGEYGRKMQTDLSDGVKYLGAAGMIDPARVCIVGASYGGYAALAGMALQPDVYRCAASVSGLADLKQFLKWTDRNHLDEPNASQRYWDRFMGVTGPDDARLDEISPIKHVDAIQGPVLLIHGKDDTVVPYEQSESMQDAMRRAHKQVEFVTLNEEDHWLSRGETRLQMLRAVVDFLRANNPPGPNVPLAAATH